MATKNWAVADCAPYISASLGRVMGMGMVSKRRSKTLGAMEAAHPRTQVTRDAALALLAALTFTAALWLPPFAALVVLALWIVVGTRKGKRR